MALCAGSDVVVCDDPGPNPCGGCEGLREPVGSACGLCGAVACAGVAAVCRDPGRNACGGCAALADPPGAACGDCGRVACAGTDAVACDDPGPNACGGCAALPHEPGDHCGWCGVLVCAQPDVVTCDDLGTNACGGCALLPDDPGDPCGTCGTLACAGEDQLACDDPGVNACGGCAALEAVPGEVCGRCGLQACDGPDSVTCDDPGSAVESFAAAPTLVQLLESYATLTWDAGDERLAWSTSTGVVPEPFATAVGLPLAGSAELDFEFEVTTMGPTGNHNISHLAWIDPTTAWDASIYGSGAPSRGVGLALQNAWSDTRTTGTYTAYAAQQAATDGVTSYLTDTMVGVAHQVHLTYDASTGGYTVTMTEIATGTVRIDAAGTMEAGLSLSMFAVTGGFAEATAPVVADGGWVDDLSCPTGACP
jgi:hypothetical protein